MSEWERGWRPIRADLSKSQQRQRQQQWQTSRWILGIVVRRFEWIKGSHRTYSHLISAWVARDSIFCIVVAAAAAVVAHSRSSKIFAWHLFYSNWFKFIASRALSLFLLLIFIFPFFLFILACVVVSWVSYSLICCLCKCCRINVILVAFRYCSWHLYECVCVHLATVLIVRNTYILGKFFLLPSSVWLVCLFV